MKLPTEGRLNRLVRRWVPAGIGSARLDPGRSGALALGLGAVGIALVVTVGLLWRSAPAAEPLPLVPAAATPQTSSTSVAETTTAPAELVVSVVGRVMTPGLVTLSAPARVADAVAAAGGAHPDADLDTVNLARPLADGEQIHVDAPVPPGAQSDGGVVGGGEAAATAGGGAAIDLNAASVAQLDSLPGVGPVTAQRILDWRTEHGRFDSVEDLREVDGIGPTRYERLKDLVTA
ncbi:ComEA family DNA-binding protein [Actinoalloteichus hymeniacidonis]|uniref:ComEA family DNA-binding protein n=1 Tax=Actinoalloteichus hymeniacidonis TaxID=340345 RepID=UPI0008534AF8|nr:ComEA family DNA-binding protein [Actinoalloteichus hymeniacidonis]MBB5909504.1 competence protein ComEA [Actinoalloteichus hymeniacidonis]